jgi:hypothetical protein
MLDRANPVHVGKDGIEAEATRDTAAPPEVRMSL